jgi:SulP family sulfate permease
VQAAILVAFLVGAIQLGITLLRLGDLTRYISHSVIVGFTLGAGSLLVLDQMKNLLGVPAVGDVHDHFLIRFGRSMLENDVHLETAAVGIGSLVAVIGLRWIKGRLGWRLLPDLLLVVVAMAALVWFLGLDAHGAVVERSRRDSPLAAPVLDAAMIRAFSTGALAIAVLGLLEAVAMAKAIAAQTRQKLDMNQQCLSEGLANFGGSFFQCFPGSGSLTRSAINQQAGAACQWSGVVSAGAVALIMLVFAPYARFIPRAALAGILMISAYRMIDWHALAYHFRTTRFDAAIVAVTALSAVVISVEFCVLIGIFLSCLLTVPRTGRMLLTEFTITRDAGIHERLHEDASCDRILVFGLEGEMFFGAASALETHFATIEASVGPHTSVLVLRVKRARNPDAVGMTLLEAFLDRMKARGVHVLLCGVRTEFAEKMERTGLTKHLGERIFLEQAVRRTSTVLAMRRAYELIDRPCAICPRQRRRAPGTRDPLRDLIRSLDARRAAASPLYGSDSLRLVALNVAGGIAVLASYAWGSRAVACPAHGPWGGVPEALRGVYTVNMLLAAAGYFPFAFLVIFRTPRDRLRAEAGVGPGAVLALFALVLIPSALWLPLTAHMLDAPSDATWLAIRGVLFAVGAGSTGLLVVVARIARS